MAENPRFGGRGRRGEALEALLDTEQERAARRLLEHAGTILRGRRGDMPEGFAALVFARAAPEDLARYEPREIAALAEDDLLFLKERSPGTAKVRRGAARRAAGRGQIVKIVII